MSYCTLRNDITTESDVEQKFLFQFLKTALDFRDEEIKTKKYFAPTNLDKGAGKIRGYYPDYALVYAGVPCVVCEAKAPNESAEAGFREATLYAHHVNKLYPNNCNPVSWVISTNGIDIVIGHWDTSNPLIVKVNKLSPGSNDEQSIVNVLHRNIIIKHVEEYIAVISPRKWHKPLRLIGTPARQNEEIAPNSFAAEIIPILRKYFETAGELESDEVIKNAYVSSDEITSYDQTLETLLKDSLLSKSGLTDLEVSKKEASKIEQALYRSVGNGFSENDPFILVVGGVGAGKSIFIKRFYKHLLSDQLRQNTLWLFVDFNNASEDLDNLDTWICEEVVRDYERKHASPDWLGYNNLRRYFAPDINKLTKGAYKKLKEIDPVEYEKRLSSYLADWSEDKVKLLESFIRYTSGDRKTPVIVVFDNVDRRDKDQQLKIFQAAKAFKNRNQCFSILSLRDETYDAYRNQPPLDAYINPYAFRITPPRFIDVVKRRLNLALKFLAKGHTETKTYSLPNGIKITYPPTKLGNYLSIIYRSLFHPSRQVRMILEALADRNIRRAIEMFASILTSGYLREDIILSITEGERTHIPEYLVIKILMRTKYKYFSESHGYLTNIFTLDENSTVSNNFLIIELLNYLSSRRKQKSVLNIEGYIQCASIIEHMCSIGYATEDVIWALEKLLNRGLIIADHQKNKDASINDHFRVSASGHWHLYLFAKRSEYIRNVAIDTWINGFESAKGIVDYRYDDYRNSLRRLKSFYEYLNGEYQQLVLEQPLFQANQKYSKQIIEEIYQLIQRDTN